MCGIAGILTSNPSDPAQLRDAIERMTAALIRRGPDGDGFHIATAENCAIALGHRRLAVIDVAGGAQPLYSADGQVAGIVNGEIYNFAHLRRELIQRGHRFATQSDSEVIVHGYLEWGEAVLERLEGMFALALWDRSARQLLLARDRMGEKPLYYAQLAGELIFASELKALLCHPAIDLDIEPRALAEYLIYEYVPAPGSIIRGVKKLAPGQFLVAKPGTGVQIKPQVHTQTYWDIPLAGQTSRLCDLDSAASLLRGALERSVESRLVADVPLGVFLSGGLDSSLIAVLACRARSGIESFSLGFEEPSYDESRHARRVARFLGTRHRELIARPSDALAVIDNLGQLLDEPLGDASIVPTHLLARFTREHVTVALSGDGGDELFDGYPTYQADFAVGHFLDRVPRPARRFLAAMTRGLAARIPVSSKNFSLDFKLKQLARGMDQRGLRRHQAWLASFLPHELTEILSRELLAELGDIDPYALIDHRLEHHAASKLADQRMYFYCKGYLGDGVLTKVDRASMHASLEVRAPLLDTGVIELACRVAPSLRSRGLQTKRVLKRAARGLLPDAIIDRSKHGFGMPLAAWLRGPLAERMSEALSPARLRRDGWLDERAVGTMVQSHLTGRANHRKPLWTLLAFHAWLDAVR